MSAHISSRKFKFFTTVHGETISSTNNNLPKTLSAAGFGGILLGIAWLILLAYFGGRVNSIREAERVLKTKAAVIFRNLEKAEINFLKKLAKNSNQVVLVGADVSVAKLREKLNLNTKTVELPRDAEKIGRNETKIVVVKLDQTRVNTLRMLRAVFEEKIKLVVWN